MGCGNEDWLPHGKVMCVSEIKVSFAPLNPLKPFFSLLSHRMIFYAFEGFLYYLHAKGLTLRGGDVFKVFKQGKDAVGLAKFMNITGSCEVHECTPCPVFPVTGRAEARGKPLLHDADSYLIERPFI